eukprot:19793-Heterococcus_DN1.PRE.1
MSYETASAIQMALLRALQSVSSSPILITDRLSASTMLPIAELCAFADQHRNKQFVHITHLIRGEVPVTQDISVHLVKTQFRDEPHGPWRALKQQKLPEAEAEAVAAAAAAAAT